MFLNNLLFCLFLSFTIITQHTGYCEKILSESSKFDISKEMIARTSTLFYLYYSKETQYFMEQDLLIVSADRSHRKMNKRAIEEVTEETGSGGFESKSSQLNCEFYYCGLSHVTFELTYLFLFDVLKYSLSKRLFYSYLFVLYFKISFIFDI